MFEFHINSKNSFKIVSETFKHVRYATKVVEKKTDFMLQAVEAFVKTFTFVGVFFLRVTRPNEFGSKTARKYDILPLKTKKCHIRS